MTTFNPIVANSVVAPINTTAADPAITFGAGTGANSSGTGIYGDATNVKIAIGGADIISYAAAGATVNAVSATTTVTAGTQVIVGTTLKLPSNVLFMVGAGVPVDGTTGDNVAGPGSFYIDITNSNLYVQASLITTPVWKLVTRAA